MQTATYSKKVKEEDPNRDDSSTYYFDNQAGNPPPKATSYDSGPSTGGVLQFNANFSDADFLAFNDSLSDEARYDFLDTLSDAEQRAYHQRAVGLNNARGGNLSSHSNAELSVSDAFFDQLGSTVGSVAPVALETAVGVLFEPVDWLLTAKEIYNHPTDPLSYLGLFPFLPASTSKLLRAADKGGDLGGSAFQAARRTGSDVVEGVASQLSKRRLAKELGGIPRSAQPVRQGRFGQGTKWWEYVDSNGKTKIVIEHPDGSVHIGIPKPQSEHLRGGPPKYFPLPGSGHVGEP